MSSLAENIDTIQPGGTGTAQVHPVEFRGTTKEYFGIWIVNVLLSIVTLGIYSAWAKVRNKKYFSGVTYIDGHNFDYHATGMQILIGRLLVLGFYLILAVTQFIHIGLYLLVFLLLLAGLGWIVSRAIRFNARMTSYRNVRFDFAGTGLKAWLVYVLFPLFVYFGIFAGIFLVIFGMDLSNTAMIAVTSILGLLVFLGSYFVIPFISRAMNRYVANNHLYGDRPFSFDAPIKPYYGALFKFLGLIALMLVLFAVLAFLLAGAFSGLTTSGMPSDGALVVGSFLYVIFLGGIFIAGLAYRVTVRNILFNNLILDDKHEFISTFEAPKYIFIMITNALAAIFSFGLAMPWARIRRARYVAANTKIVAKGELGGYSSSVIESAGVSSAEYADMEGFGINVGIGI